MTQPVCTNRFIVHYLIYIVLSLIFVIALLSLSGCCNEFYGVGSGTRAAKTVEQDVNSEMINTDDATEVNIAIATERVIGDDAAAAGLMAHKEFKYETYSNKGSSAYKTGNYDTALKNYQEAVKWVDEEDDRKGVAYRNIADCYRHIAGLTIRADESDPYYRKAVETYLKSAEYGDDNHKAYRYFEAAMSSYRGGSRKDACNYFRKAWAESSDPNFRAYCDSVMKKVCAEKVN